MGYVVVVIATVRLFVAQAVEQLRGMLGAMQVKSLVSNLAVILLNGVMLYRP